VNDSVLFLAFATMFGVAMLIVGWAGRGYYQDRVMDKILADWQVYRDSPDPADSAGA